jgi:hypothetical protein
MRHRDQESCQCLFVLVRLPRIDSIYLFRDYKVGCGQNSQPSGRASGCSVKSFDFAGVALMEQKARAVSLQLV